jgi:voltage-gated potassium channel
MNASRPESQERVSTFQLVLGILSLVVIAALIADAIAPLPKEVSEILQALDLVVCILFFIDFCVRFAGAESKAAFLKWGWIDLIACIPNIDILRVGRMVRLLRIIRLIRGIRASRRIISVLAEHKPKTVFASVLMTMLLLITFASISILIAEKPPEANIRTAEDAVWWSVTTITTVGYGDKFPISTGGRLIAMVLMLSGVGLFGTLSGLVASFFLGKREEPPENEVLQRLRAIEQKLDERPTNPTSSR